MCIRDRFIGGSMMYINSLKNGLSNDTGADQAFRDELLSREQADPGILHTELTSLNPEAAKKIAANDLVRLVRAIERVTLPTTGEKLEGIASSELIEIGLFPSDRSFLQKNIEQRQHQIISNGLLEECQEIFENNSLPKHHPIQKAVNYKQGFQVLRKEITHDELFEKSLIATRQLAKKQLTWMRSWESMEFFDLMDENKIFQYIQKTLDI